MRAVTAGGVDAAANAAARGSAAAVRAVRDGGRLATITADLPAAERDIAMRRCWSSRTADGWALWSELLAQGVLTVSVADRFPFEQAAVALARATHGAHGSAIVLETGNPD